MSDYPDTPTQRLLARLDACDDARTWVGERDAETAWTECPKGDWLLFVLYDFDYPQRKEVLAVEDSFQLRLITNDDKMYYAESEAWNALIAQHGKSAGNDYYILTEDERRADPRFADFHAAKDAILREWERVEAVIQQELADAIRLVLPTCPAEVTRV
jgi:hypothetical protein